MGLLELVSTYGLTPKRKGATRGGEFSSPCPSCGGTDRFILHPKAYDGKGAYFCRQCGIKGDGIQFGRDFLNYSFNQAKKQLGLGDTFYFESSNCSSVAAMSQIKLQVTDQQKWTKKAGAFVECASKRLCSSQSLDWDEAGKKAYEYWRSFPNLKPWPAANGKSIGDDFIAGVDLLAWVSQGVQIYT